jgi:hypothetical protein
LLQRCCSAAQDGVPVDGALGIADPSAAMVSSAGMASTVVDALDDADLASLSMVATPSTSSAYAAPSDLDGVAGANRVKLANLRPYASGMVRMSSSAAAPTALGVSSLDDGAAVDYVRLANLRPYASAASSALSFSYTTISASTGAPGPTANAQPEIIIPLDLGEPSSIASATPTPAPLLSLPSRSSAHARPTHSSALLDEVDRAAISMLRGTGAQSATRTSPSAEPTVEMTTTTPAPHQSMTASSDVQSASASGSVSASAAAPPSTTADTTTATQASNTATPSQSPSLGSLFDGSDGQDADALDADYSTPQRNVKLGGQPSRARTPTAATSTLSLSVPSASLAPSSLASDTRTNSPSAASATFTFSVVAAATASSGVSGSDGGEAANLLAMQSDAGLRTSSAKIGGTPPAMFSTFVSSSATPSLATAPADGSLTLPSVTDGGRPTTPTLSTDNARALTLSTPAAASELTVPTAQPTHAHASDETCNCSEKTTVADYKTTVGLRRRGRSMTISTRTTIALSEPSASAPPSEELPLTA